MRFASDVQPNVQQDPIDRYLGVLASTKAYLDQSLPKLDAGINQILGSSTGKLIPNGIPQNLGTNAYNPYKNGYANFNQASPNKSSGTTDYVNQLIANNYKPGAYPKVQGLEQSKVWGIESGTGKQFNFDRYYSHGKFKELGWNPYIDNEAYYNANSTWVDDFKRAAGQWWGLAGIGFTQTAGNWDDLFSLNTNGDTKAAREMSKAMGIAASTRGGIGGFVTNQFANSAYTFGVIGEIVAEEVALWGATALTEGALGEVALMRTAKNLDRLKDAGTAADRTADAIREGRTVEDVGESLGTASNSLNDVNGARKFWNGVGNFVNPFDDLTETVKNLRTGENGFDKMTDFAKTSKTFGAFYRDVRMMNTALAESRLEGGMVQNETFDKLVQDHIGRTGQAPIGDDLNRIMTQAKLAGVNTTLANVPAIFFSNKIVFEKALGGFKPFRELTKGGLGTMVENVVKKAGKDKYAGFIDTANPRNWFTKKYVKHTINQFKPSNLAKSGLRYMAANLTEGLQETYQEGISKAMTDYYVNSYISPEIAGTSYYKQMLSEGFGSQLSAQGAETFLSGFLMGGLVQGPQAALTQAAPQLAKDIYNKYKNPQEYSRQKEERAAERNKITNFMNVLASDPNKVFDPISANIKAQKDFSEIMDRAEANGDKKEHADAVQDSIFTNVQTLLDKGYIDLFTNQIEDYQKLNDKELSEAFGYTAESGNKDEFNKDLRGRLDSILKKTNDIKARHEKYSSIKNPFAYDSEDFMERLDYFGFEEARKQAIYNEYTYDRAQSRMASLLEAVAADPVLAKAKAGRITSIFNEVQLDAELDTLKDEIKIYAEGDAKQKEISAKKQRQYDSLLRIKNSMSNHGIEVERARKAAVSPEKTEEIKNDVITNESIGVGSTVSYQPKSGLPISGKVIKKTNTKVTIQYTDKNGEVKTKVVSINAKSLKGIGTSGQQMEIDFEGSDPASRNVDYFKKELKADLEEYLKVLAENSEDGGQPILSTDIDRIFSYLEDYLELGVDARAASMNVNLLNDPMYFSEAAKKFSAAAKAAQEIAAAKLKEAWNVYEARMQTNQLLRDIYEKFNVFFMPEEIDKLVKGESIPSVFIDAGTKKPIETNSLKYREILEFLEIFEEANGFTLAGKEISEESAESFQRPYDFTEKDDTRTYKDFVKALGLDPKLKSQMIPTKDLLKYIIKNKFSKPGAKALARRLMTTVKDSDQIEISSTSPQAFIYSKTAGITIDLRYSSKDYGQMQVSLEYSVLNPMLQKIVEEGLLDDKFNKATTNLMDAVREYYEANRDSIKDPNLNAMFKFMLSSPQAFLSEALTNTVAQTELEAIPYKNTNKNMWEEVLDAFREFLAKLLGFSQSSSNTALTEAIGIISNKVENRPIIGSTEDIGITPTDTSAAAITVDTPFNDMPKDLQTMLRAELKIFNQEQISNNKPIIPDSEISRFIKQSNRAKQLIDNYNKRNGLTGAPISTKTDTNNIVSEKMVDGYKITTFDDGMIDVTKDGEVIGIAFSTEAKALEIIEQHKKGEKPKSKIKDKFKGLLIYTTLASSVDDLDSIKEGVINGETLLAEALADNGQSIEGTTIDAVMYKLFVKDKALAEKVYDDALAKMEAAVNAGDTVVTTIGRFAQKADMVLIHTNDNVIVDKAGKDAVSRVRAYESAAKKTKVRSNIQILEIDAPIIDVLTGKAKATSLKEKYKGKVRESIENAKSMEEIDDINRETTSLVLEDENLTAEEFKELMDKKMQELSSKIPTFEEVEKNDLVVMKDRKQYGRSGIVQVLGKNTTNGTVKVKRLNSTEAMTLSKEEFENGAEYMYRAGTEKLEPTVTVTADEKQNSNSNMESAGDINNVDAIKEDLEKAKNSSAEDIDDEFNNSFGCE
jgi:uncharacterized protein YuzE